MTTLKEERFRKCNFFQKDLKYAIQQNRLKIHKILALTTSKAEDSERAVNPETIMHM